MGKIAKYLAQAWPATLIVFLLLVVQAFCDLRLPQYTSDIVDVGIGQGGIEYAAPEKLREETYEDLSLFMTAEERNTVAGAYRQKADGTYELVSGDKETCEKIDETMKLPMVFLSMLNSGQSPYDLGQIKDMVAAGMVTEEDLLAMREQALAKMGDQSDTIVKGQAVQFVKSEYEAMGMDTGKVQTDFLWKTGFKMLGLSALMLLAAILTGYFASVTAAKIGKNLREKMFARVISFSSEEMDKFSTASLITRCTNDIQQVQMVIVVLLRMVLYAPIIGVGGVIKVVNSGTGMGWIIGVAVGTILALVLILLLVAMPKFKILQSLVDNINLISREILTGVPVIRAFSREHYEEKRFDKANKDLMKTQLFTGRVMNFMMPVMMLIMNAITIMIVWFGGKNIDAGTMQVGSMLAFITYTMQIVMAFLMLTMVSIMLPRAGVAADRIEEVLKTEPKITDKKDVKDAELTGIKGEITFENVAFRYPEAKEDALHDISFTAKPGETTAIIGSTGCGKSTLLNLIPRFYDVTEGRILLDGVDIRDISQHKLRSVLGLVPQKAVLFSGDIASNVKFAHEDISDEKMKKAAEIAQATEFIDSKPEKYESPISQGGTNVSGGQKQRLSIARAVAAEPKIFLFDDSFSALDYKTDVTLRKALAQNTADATVIIVAQRISTILHANRIIVLENGTIAGMGTHEELLANCPAYREIAKSQLSEKELQGGAGA